MKRFLCNRVDAYFSGHAHHLEFDIISECNMDHYISGAGGARLYGIRAQHSAEFAQSVHGFLELTLSEEEMTSQFISITGEKLFKTQRNKTQ